MINIYATSKGKPVKVNNIAPDTWVDIYEPTKKELELVQNTLNIDMGLLCAALDEEERSRIDFENDDMLVLVDTPTVNSEGEHAGVYSTLPYSTLPYGIIITKENIITVCLKESALSLSFIRGAIKSFSAKKKNRMTLQMLYRNSTLFLDYLREVERASNIVESRLHLSMKNKELIQMLGLEKSLVYFSTSLKSNEIVLERLLRMDFVRDYPDDRELLEDVIIENKQAIEMSNIYRDILSGTMDAFASIISNNLNMVMKLLAALTIILTIPTIVFGLWGSNVPVPLQNSPFGFWVVLAIAIVITSVAVFVMKKNKWL